MNNLSQLIQRIPTDKPYSIVIFRTFIDPYRVEGYDHETDIDIFGKGTLAACNQLFDTIKAALGNAGHRVQETGYRGIMLPRTVLINASPYHIWKTLYDTLRGQPSIRNTDKILRERIP